MIKCPNCGSIQKMEPGTTYFCNPDAFSTRRKYGFLCYGCHATIFIREDGLLDIFYLSTAKITPSIQLGVKPKFDSEFFGIKAMVEVKE